MSWGISRKLTAGIESCNIKVKLYLWLISSYQYSNTRLTCPIANDTFKNWVRF